MVADYWKKTLMTAEQQQSGPITDEEKQKSDCKTGGIRSSGGLRVEPAPQGPPAAQEGTAAPVGGLGGGGSDWWTNEVRVQ